MNAFQTALEAVLPLFALLALGVGLRRAGMTDKHTLDRMNLLSFRIFLPVSLYYNIVTADLTQVFDRQLLAFGLISQFGVLGLSVLVALFTEKAPKRRGALAQGIFQTNIVIFGTLIGTSLCGEGNLGSISLLIAAVAPMQNLLSVVLLELCRGNSKLNKKEIVVGVLKNPFVIAALAGFATQLLPVSFPTVILNIVRDVGRCGTPIALIVMGGLFNFEAVRSNRKAIAVGVFARLAAVPLIMIPIALSLGFRGPAMVGLACVFMAPSATSSFNLASAMDSDADLAAQLVVFTSLFSLGTVFCWVFVLSRMGML